VKIGRLIVDVAPLDCWEAYGRPKQKHHLLGVILAGFASWLFSNDGYQVEPWLVLDGDNTNGRFSDWRSQCLTSMKRMGYHPHVVMEEFDIKSQPGSHESTIRSYGIEPALKNGILSCTSAETVLTDMKFSDGRASVILTGYPRDYHGMYGPNSNFRRELLPLLTNGNGVALSFVYPYNPSQEAIRKEIQNNGTQPTRETESLVRLAVVLAYYDQECVSSLPEATRMALRSRQAFTSGNYDPDTGLVREIVDTESLEPLHNLVTEYSGNLAYLHQQCMEGMRNG